MELIVPIPMLRTAILLGKFKLRVKDAAAWPGSWARLLLILCSQLTSP